MIDPDRQRIACDGKQRLTHDRAIQVARDMRRRGRESVQAYVCPHCHRWHVGQGTGRKPGK